ncbi:MAG: chemoreceptor glutamine deamidase CheD [Chromatiales bacterium]|nr:chemoreceptor glutamine deamidase CheD [Chromatiales bacterium]
MDAVLPGFEHINRYWDNTHNCVVAKILPGDYYVTTKNEMILTVLGSCVSACVRDSANGVGGMNHFMLPTQGAGSASSWEAPGVDASTRYGSHAMERLINDILKYGGRRDRLEVKVFGGGKIISHMADIGRKNIDFVQSYIEDEGIRLVASDLGDIYPRKIFYQPSTGKVFMKRLLKMHDDNIVARERAYQQALVRKQDGDVTLF